VKEQDVKKGMKVKISNDLSKTENRWSTSEEMLNMRGKIYKITNLSGEGVHIADEYGSGWIFCCEDVEEVPTKPPPPPVTFDPANLST